MDARLRAAFAAVARPRFLPSSQKPYADRDEPLPIGFGVTNSQPSTVANMLALLDVRAGDTVLDVGAGSGWTAGLLAHLVGPTGHVLGVERVPELVARAAQALVDWPWAKVKQAEQGVLGSPADAPFDRILVSAMAAEFPEALVTQLAPGGVLVVPVEGVMQRVVLGPDGQVEVTEHGYYSFVPLIP